MVRLPRFFSAIVLCVAVLCGLCAWHFERQPPAAFAQSVTPAQALPLQFVPKERIAFVGNSLAERMNLFGHFESAAARAVSAT